MTENFEPCAKQTWEQGLYEEALEQFAKTNTKARALWGGIGAIFAKQTQKQGLYEGALEQFLQTTTQPQVKMDEGQFVLFDLGFVWFA
jgi:hypothetical protein